MKRILLVVIIAMSTCALCADDYAYPYMIFTNADGSQSAMAVDHLEITFVDGKLVATNGAGQASLTLADLASMQFSTSEDGISDEIVTITLSREIQPSTPSVVYDLSGRRAYQPKGKVIPRGIYIVRDANGKTSKMAIK